MPFLPDKLYANREDGDIDKFVTFIPSSSLQKDFLLETSFLQSLHHLIQWSCNFALHLFASIPDNRVGSGVTTYSLPALKVDK